MEPTTTFLKVRVPAAVAEPRGAIAVGHLVDACLQLARFVKEAAHEVVQASRRSRGSWQE